MMNVVLTHVDLVHVNERDVLVDGVFTQKRPNGVDCSCSKKIYGCCYYF
jgi:hypothetical protein